MIQFARAEHNQDRGALSLGRQLGPRQRKLSAAWEVAAAAAADESSANIKESEELNKVNKPTQLLERTQAMALCVVYL